LKVFSPMTHQVFPHLVQWHFLSRAHQRGPKNFKVFGSVSHL
jgi:hypothetical protein